MSAFGKLNMAAYAKTLNARTSNGIGWNVDSDLECLFKSCI